jgi:hypothetical protein
MHLSLAAFKVMVRDQFFILQLEPERAIEVLPSLVPKADARTELLKQVRMIAGAGDPLTAAENDRLDRLSQAFAVSTAKPTAPTASGQPDVPRKPARPDAVVH